MEDSKSSSQLSRIGQLLLNIRNSSTHSNQIRFRVWLPISIIITLATFAYAQASNYQLIDTPILLDIGIFFLVVILEVLIVIMVRHTCPKRTWTFATSLALCVATLWVAGAQLEYTGAILWDFKTVGYIVFCWVPLITTFALLLRWFEKGLPKQDNDLHYFCVKHQKLLVFLIIFVIWFLGYLALFPGVYDYDAGNKIYEFVNPSYGVGTRYAVLHSAILYFFVRSGQLLFDSAQIGFGVYIFLQMLFIIYVCSTICNYIFERFQNRKFLVLSVAFFVFFPHLMVISVSSYQDVLFGGVFALIVLKTIKLVENPRGFFSKWQQSAIYILLVLLLCMLRNNGIYVILLSVPLFLLLLKNFRIKALVLLLIPILLFEFYSGPVLAGLGVRKDDPLREMLSIPLQQLARVYTYRIDTLDNDQLYYLLELVPAKDLAVYPYNPSIADRQKANLNVELLRSDVSKFFNVYLSAGARNPRTYLEAAMMNTLGFWYPTKGYPDPRMYHPYLEFKMMDFSYPWVPATIQIDRTSLFPAYERLLNKLIYQNFLTNTPFISVFFTMGSYFIIFLLMITVVLYRKSYILLVPIALIFSLYTTIFLGPVALLRYVFPIILCTPLMIGMIYLAHPKEGAIEV